MAFSSHLLIILILFTSCLQNITIKGIFQREPGKQARVDDCFLFAKKEVVASRYRAI